MQQEQLCKKMSGNMSVTNYDGRLEQWYTDSIKTLYALNNETLPDPVPLPKITNYDGMLEAIAETAGECAVRAEEIAEAIKDGTINHDDTENAYVFQFPDAVYKFDELKKLGGKTIVFNQLVDTGTTSVTTISGRKYYTVIDGVKSIITSDGSAIDVVDDAADMVIDLTLMYGSGKEPGTVDDVLTVLPSEHYTYNAGALLSADVSNVISKDKNGTVLQDYAVPDEVQAITGYGWPAGSAYNYIDFNAKTFVQNVSKVDIGTLTWSKESNGFFKCGVADTPVDSRSNIMTGIGTSCSTYANFDGSKSYTAFKNTEKQIWMNTSKISSGRLIVVCDSDFEDAASFMAGVDGVYLYYELETPVVTDISEYLTEALTDVASGGTLTMPNSNGDDYHIPAAIEVSYTGA